MSVASALDLAQALGAVEGYLKPIFRLSGVGEPRALQRRTV